MILPDDDILVMHTYRMCAVDLNYYLRSFSSC